MDFNAFKLGDLIEFRRCAPYLSDSFVNRGVFLGFEWDITPSGVGNYIRLYMLEFGGRFFSVICWIERDRITKIE
jgi:hypothetical protein